MPGKDILRGALEMAFTDTPILPNPTLEPLPASSSSKAAIRRCRAAWKRAYDIYLEDGGDNLMNRSTAASKAAPVYCAAMPALDSLDNVRDFIACTAHGILIEAIPAHRAGQLLYSAQVALGVLQCQAKTTAKRKKRTHPLYRKNSPTLSRNPMQVKASQSLANSMRLSSSKYNCLFLSHFCHLLGTFRQETGCWDPALQAGSRRYWREDKTRGREAMSPGMRWPSPCQNRQRTK
ncbi:MAG: hypothetical protein ACLQHF_08650 [Terracidiphilus sp.]